MNNKKSLIITLVMILVVGLSIAAGTFAYFQWTTGAEGGTAVNVTIEMGGITMHIEPEQTEFVGLYPTVHCENNVKYGDALVTIVNNTGTLAIPSFRLKVRVTKGGSGELTSDMLKHINFTVVPIETTTDAQGNPIKVNNNNYSCSSDDSGDDASGSLGGIFNNYSYNWSTRELKFPSISTSGEWTHVPNMGDITAGMSLSGDGYLPRQYYVQENPNGYKPGDVKGITFRGEAYSTTYQYYRVYVWIDEGYTSTIVGNTVSDPLQNAKIEVTWSEESIVQQVSGESNTNNDNNNKPLLLDAGLYDNDGNMVKTWNELVSSDKVVIYNPPGTYQLQGVDSSLTGILVVDNEVIEIEGYAFQNSNLTEVRFEENSQLKGIYDHAFQDTYIKKIDLPDGLEYIYSYVFYNSKVEYLKLPVTVISLGDHAFDGMLINTIDYAGTKNQWYGIYRGEDWNVSGDLKKVVCTDGIVYPLSAGLYDNSDTFTSWDELISEYRVYVDTDDGNGDGNMINLHTLDETFAGTFVVRDGILTSGNHTGVRSTIYTENDLEVIFPEGFTNINNNTVTLLGGDIEIYVPKTLRVIDSGAFYQETSGTLTIYYEGTMEEWNDNVSVGTNEVAYKVVFIDGDYITN